MKKDYKYKVCTQCVTFNHSLYIEDTLRGFAIQETSFPVVFVIVDDASTDGEQSLLRKWGAENLVLSDDGYQTVEKYGEVVYGHLRNKNNLWFAIVLLNNNHYSLNQSKLPYFENWSSESKYEAFCEGDDYWIHPMKLQRQIQFLDNNDDYSMCFCNALVTYDQQDRAANCFNSINKDREIHLEELLDKWICPTQGMVIRHNVRPLFPVKGKIVGSDWQIVLHCFACGKIWGMKSVMSCYRKTDLPTSMSNTYSRRSDEAFLKKVPILEGFDEYTEGKYHDLVSKYINYYSKMGQLVAFKKKHGMLITCLLKPFTLIEMVWKRSIRPRIDKNAPTYSA